MPAMLSCVQPLCCECVITSLVYGLGKNVSLFCFDLILLVFFLKLYSDAQYVSSKALLSSLQLMNSVMALEKKQNKTKPKPSR